MYEIEVKGLQEAVAELGRFDEVADKHLMKAMKQGTTTIVSEVRPLTPVFMGLLRNSIASEVIREGPGSIIGKVGSTLKDEEYPAVMEYGRKPGATMPPPEKLERWVHLKLGVPEEKAHGVAFTVARAIARRGIAGKFFLKRGFEAAQGRVERYFAQALEAIANELAGKG